MKQKITINEIAKLVGVSKATVSFYLNGHYEKMSEETRQKIQSVIDKTGYHPSTTARSLNAKDSHLIGVIIGDITNSFANQIVKGINDVICEYGYQMIVGASSYETDNEEKIMKGMLAMGTDGFIIQPTVTFGETLHSLHVDSPIVYFDSPDLESSGLWVKTNNYEACYQAASKMKEAGYMHFVIITADPAVLATRAERNNGFIDFLKSQNLSYDMYIADSHTSTAELETFLLTYINSERSTCVFVCNNWLLDKTYLVLRNYISYIPNRIGLIGFDSLEWSELAVPSITTIVQPAYEEGKAAARLLIDRIENKNKENPHQVLTCRINELNSTKKV